MIPNEYKVLCLAVEEGVNSGWSRAHKHTDDPDPQYVRDAITDAVICSISKWFEYEPMPSDVLDSVRRNVFSAIEDDRIRCALGTTNP